ncbi:MAG: hypothetical protein QY332_11510 [Anaerolineales bacterium]|nr:MAG: hypothetical protein QY332_11510 [Anaerolineales bacterium]
MERFVIESPHSEENCDQVVRDLHAAGYLHQFEWGCKDNHHTAWAIVDAENREHARQIVPWYVRDKVRVVRLVKFEIADEEHHKTDNV